MEGPLKALRGKTLLTWNSISSENLFQKWRRNKDMFRQTKTERIYHQLNCTIKKYTYTYTHIMSTWCEELIHWKRFWCWETLRQKEKGAAEDEMVGWYHQLNGHEFEQTLGDSEEQGSLVCCSPWGLKQLDMTPWLNNNKDSAYRKLSLLPKTRWRN